MPATRSLALVLAGCLLAACNAAAGAGPTPTPTPEPTPTEVPGPGGAGGGSGSNLGGGAVPPGGIVDPGGGVDPVLGQAHLVSPTPGLINQHPVSVQRIRAAADADGVTVELRWWSGVAPCSALDSVQVAREDATKKIRLTVIEGSGKGDVACIDIAELKATLVNLGDLAAGSWTISAEGDAPAVTIEIT
jgi:hypothetical protein